jgi:hypothetical protein
MKLKTMVAHSHIKLATAAASLPMDAALPTLPVAAATVGRQARAVSENLRCEKGCDKQDTGTPLGLQLQRIQAADHAAVLHMHLVVVGAVLAKDVLAGNQRAADQVD